MPDPYKSGLFTANPYAKSRAVEGVLVTVLDAKLDSRQLDLIAPISRALKQGEIHELIITPEAGAAPGGRVARVAYLGFFEVTQGGMAVVGVEVRIGGRPLGVLAGFDETHYPNHLNIVLKGGPYATGLDLGLALHDPVTFVHQDAR